jgi:serine/threonine-protein kinase HipA
MTAQLGQISLKGGATPYTSAFLKRMFKLSGLPANGLKVKGDQTSFNQAAPEYVDGQSISGVQKKLFMDLKDNYLVPVKGQGRFIVKPAPENLLHLPENEHAIMQLARLCKFKVADNALVPFENGELCYVTRRFDLLDDGRRLFVEDAASLCNIHSSNKGSDNLSYEGVLRTLYAASGGNMAVIYNGVRQVLFAYLVGNNDLHCKNFSMYRNPDDATVRMRDFTPIYDALSVAPYRDYYNEDLTLCVLNSELDAVFSASYEAAGHYSMECFVTLATNLGMNSRAANKLVVQLCRDVARYFQPLLAASSSPDKTAIEQHIKGKLRRFTTDIPDLLMG